jgi:ABC-2 type transport system ATP-binding protein
MLTCLIAPTSGTALVNGYQVGKDSMAVRRSVGILTETPGFYDRLSVEYNLRFYAKLYEVAEVAAQVEKYLRLLGLWERREDTAATLSKGMRQKLAIARSLLHEPRVLFLDEPTASLDPEAAHTVREFIAELRRKGRTILLCTHNLEEADRLCDRIAVLKTRLLMVDKPAGLRTKLFGRKVVFHLRQANEALRNAVASLSFVQECSILDNKLVLTLEDPETYNPEIVRLLVNLGADVLFVGELRRSLEDVYLQLIRAV